MAAYEALAVVEIRYFANAVRILDQMVKAANVEFLSSEKYLGGRLVTMILGGSVTDAKNAVEIAKETCAEMPENPLRMALVISNPHPAIMKYILSVQKKQAEKKDGGQVRVIKGQKSPLKENEQSTNQKNKTKSKQSVKNNVEEERS